MGVSRGRGARLGVVWSQRQEATSEAADKQGGGDPEGSGGELSGCLINQSKQPVVKSRKILLSDYRQFEEAARGKQSEAIQK